MSVPVSGEVETLRKALAFYADIRNHRGVGVSAVYRDRGNRARQVLGGCPRCKGRGHVATGGVVCDQDGCDPEYATCRDCWGAGI